MAVAEYRCGVTEAELAQAETSMRRHLPVAWRRYLQRPDWFCRGFMASGAYVALFPPARTAALKRMCASAVPRLRQRALVHLRGTIHSALLRNFGLAFLVGK